MEELCSVTDFGGADFEGHLSRYPSAESAHIPILTKSSNEDVNKVLKLNTRAKSEVDDEWVETIDVSSPYRIAVLDRGHPAAQIQILRPAITAGQLASITTYLYLLAKTAYSGSLNENLVPKLFLAGQVADHLHNILDFVLGLAGTIKFQSKPRDKLRLRGSDDPTKDPSAGFPNVDLIITCCKQPLDVVLDTAVAACNLYWPSSKLNILIADDGKDTQLKEAIEDLGVTYHNIKYWSRDKPKGKHHGWKAGNINQALLGPLGGPNPNPFFCCLDADMIPDQEMMSALAAHAVQDPQVGMVSLPQDFYNIPTNDALHQNLILQHESDQAGRDKLGAAWCLGTGFLVRRSAWESVGGFNETSIGDDILFGWFLNGAGWKTAHANERLQSGLQPDTFIEHVQQRRRWWTGGVYNGIFLRGGTHSALSKMTFFQHLACIVQAPKPWLTTCFKAFTWLVVVCCLALNRPVVNTTNMEDFVKILACLCVFAVLGRLSESLSTRGGGYANLRRRQDSSIWIGLHLTMACLRESIPSWLGGCKLPFQVTGVKGPQFDERNALTRPGPLMRLWIIHQSERILWHFVLFSLIVCLFIFDIGKIAGNTSGSEMWLALLSGPLFPGLRLDQIVWFLSPIRYAIFPPTMKDRRAYMFKAYPDQKIGGYRPRPEHRGVRFTKSVWLDHLPYAIATIWATLALAKVYAIIFS